METPFEVWKKSQQLVIDFIVIAFVVKANRFMERLARFRDEGESSMQNFVVANFAEISKS